MTIALTPLGEQARTLDERFARSPAGPMPRGRGAGTAILAPGTPLCMPLARLAALFWRGKHFHPVRGELVNLLTPFELRFVRAAVREAPSLLDGQPCLVLDYSKTSLVARAARDEIREIAPGEYLGFVFLAGHRLPVRFLLNFNGQS